MVAVSAYLYKVGTSINIIDNKLLVFPAYTGDAFLSDVRLVAVIAVEGNVPDIQAKLLIGMYGQRDGSLCWLLYHVPVFFIGIVKVIVT